MWPHSHANADVLPCRFVLSYVESSCAELESMRAKRNKLRGQCNSKCDELQQFSIQQFERQMQKLRSDIDTKIQTRTMTEVIFKARQNQLEAESKQTLLMQSVVAFIVLILTLIAFRQVGGFQGSKRLFFKLSHVANTKTVRRDLRLGVVVFLAVLMALCLWSAIR